MLDNHEHCHHGSVFPLGEYYIERRQKMLIKWVLTRRMTTMDLEQADLDGDRQVGYVKQLVIFMVNLIQK